MLFYVQFCLFTLTLYYFKKYNNLAYRISIHILSKFTMHRQSILHSLNASIQKIPSNSLHQRIHQLIQLLFKNSNKFCGITPSLDQFKEILSHSFNCYDQIDFIALQFTKHFTVSLDPKVIAIQLQKISRITKLLFSHIKRCIDAYAFDLSCSSYNQNRFDSFSGISNAKCSMCNNNFENIAIRQVKQQIFGRFDLKEMYDQELKEDEEDRERFLADAKVAPETNQYVHSITFLTKMIREMEDKVQNYDQFIGKIQKQEKSSDQIALIFLEDMVNKMKSQLGQKCKTKLKKMVKCWEQKDGELNPTQIKQAIFQQVDIMITSKETLTVKKRNNSFTNPQQVLIRRLKEQNIRLKNQKININAMYTSTKQILNQLQEREKQFSFKRQLSSRKSFENRKNSRVSLRRESIMDTKYNEDRDSSINQQIIKKERVIKEGVMVVTGREGGNSQGNMKRLSIFNLRKQSKMIDNETIQKSSFYKDYTEELKNIDVSQKNQNYMSEQSIDPKDNIVKMIEVGCQWEDQINERRIKNIVKKKTIELNRFKQLSAEIEHNQTAKEGMSQNKVYKNELTLFNSQKNITNKAVVLIKSNQEVNENYNQAKLNKQKKTSKINIRNSLQIIKNQQLKKQSKGGKQQNGKIIKQKKKYSKINRENQIQEHQGPQELDNKNKTKPKRGNSQNSKIWKKNNQTTAHLARQMRTTIQFTEPRLDTQKKDHFQMKITEKQNKNKRFKTQLDDIQKKKERKIKNTLFKPEHLSLFGGVSESYSFQKSKLINNQSNLTEKQLQHFHSLFKYILNLKGFKNSFFQNVVSFIGHPFELIQKNDVLYRTITESQINSLILKLLFFHKFKCGHTNCQHLSNFSLIIGHSFSQ